MTYKPGDVVYVPFPYADASTKKKRPAFVLTRPVNGGRDVILCAMTSRLTNTDESVLVEPTDMAEGRLALPSRIKVTKLQTLSTRLVLRRLGCVEDHILNQVRKELRAVLLA